MLVAMPPSPTPTRRFPADRPYSSPNVRRSTRLAPEQTPTRVSPRHQPSPAGQSSASRHPSISRTPQAKRRRTPVDATPYNNVEPLTKAAPAPSGSKFIEEVTTAQTTKSSSKRKSVEADESQDRTTASVGSRRKKRKENAAASSVTSYSSASSSKRKADSAEDGHEGKASPAAGRRKKRRESAVEREPPSLSQHLSQMRAIIKNKPRPRCPTNKYGTRSAASSLEPVNADSVNSAPALSTPSPEEELPPAPPTPRSPLASPPLSLELNEIPAIEDILPVFQAPSSQPEATGETPLDPIPIEPSQKEISLHSPETPQNTTSYVTYTNLTSTFPEVSFDVPIAAPCTPSPVTPQAPSLLSELQDGGFPFPPGPDTPSPSSGMDLLNPSEVAATFGQDQVDGISLFPSDVSSGAGTTDAQGAWMVNPVDAEQRQREIDEWHRRDREMKRARLDQERLWIPRVKRYFEEFFRIAGGMKTVRDTVLVQARQQEARQAAVAAASRSSTAFSAAPSPAASTSTAPDTEAIDAVKSLSFENVSPETYTNDLDAESDEDEDDEELDSNDSSVDTAMELDMDISDSDADPHLSTPYTPVIPRRPIHPPTDTDSYSVHASPSSLGTPPFLERRQAWGGDRIFTAWMRPSVERSLTGSCLTSYHGSPQSHPSSDGSLYFLPSPSASSPSSITNSSSAGSDLLSSPNPTDVSLFPETSGFDDPKIFNLIMNGPGFGFDTASWGENLTSDLNLSTGPWQESESTPNFPRVSQALNMSSSTLDSALG